MPSAWGFRIKSGFADAVLLTVHGTSVRVVQFAEVLLSDPEVPETRQPYHAGFGELETDDAKVRNRVRRIRSVGAISLRRLVQGSEVGAKVRRAGVVVGSLIDPATIANPHIRAHALEGRLFRTVLEALLRTRSISSSLFIERTLYQEAAIALHQTPARLKKAVARLPHPEGTWRANQKVAALAAWRVLS